MYLVKSFINLGFLAIQFDHSQISNISISYNFEYFV